MIIAFNSHAGMAVFLVARGNKSCNCSKNGRVSHAQRTQSVSDLQQFENKGVCVEIADVIIL